MSEIILKSGESANIIVKKNDSFSRSANVSRAGMLFSSSVDEYLPRRKRKSQGIRFYDLGVKNNISIFKQYIPAWDEFDIEVIKIGLTNLYREVEAEIFAVNLTDFESSFKLVEKGDIQGEILAVSYESLPFSETLNEAASFNNSVLTIPENELESLYIATGAGFSHSSLFYPHNLYLGDVSEFTITNLQDPEAEIVEFTPSQQMDIYLAPGVINNYAFADYSIDAPSVPSEIWYDSLNQFYQTLDRNTVKNFFDNFLKYEDYTGDNYSYYQYYKYSQFLKSFPNSRLQKYTSILGIPYYYYESGSNFMSQPCFTPNGFEQVVGDTQYFLWSGWAVITDASLYDVKKLIYIIKKENEWYYFWK